MRVKNWQADWLEGLTRLLLERAIMTLGVRNRRRSPGPAGGISSTSMRQTAPFLNSDRSDATPISRAPSSPITRLVSDQRDAALARRASRGRPDDRGA